jgi:predicted ester cyclase
LGCLPWARALPFGPPPCSPVTSGFGFGTDIATVGVRLVPMATGLGGKDRAVPMSVTVPGRSPATLAADPRRERGGGMSEACKELVRRHFEEIFNRRNLAVADELMAVEYLKHAVAPFGQAEPGRINGPVAMRQTAQWLLAQFPHLHMRIEAIVAEGDTVAVRILSEGTNLGPLNGVPPTGKRFAARQSHWFRVGRQAGRALGHPRGPGGDAAVGRRAASGSAAALA